MPVVLVAMLVVPTALSLVYAAMEAGCIAGPVARCIRRASYRDSRAQNPEAG
jgi:hypothetical protein